MSAKKRNEFLDASDSEEDAQGYNSEDEVTKGGRSAKRRKVDESDEDSEPADIDAESDEEDETKQEDGKIQQATDDTSKASKKKLPIDQLPDVTRPALRKNLVQTDAAIKKSGVVYLSRIPPFMKPAKLRSLLEPYGTINRIFLAPEDPTAHARRVRAGGNKKRTYTEGWVEFVKKKHAKTVCELLNARTVGGKKGSYYHDDLWNLMYLKGFKWHNLTDQIAGENAERASRMRAEITKSTKENKAFVRNVERAKMLDGMAAKSKKRKPGSTEDEPKTGGRSFKQVTTVKKSLSEEQQPEQVTRVLSKIF